MAEIDTRKLWTLNTLPFVCFFFSVNHLNDGLHLHMYHAGVMEIEAYFQIPLHDEKKKL